MRLSSPSSLPPVARIRHGSWGGNDLPWKDTGRIESSSLSRGVQDVLTSLVASESTALDVGALALRLPPSSPRASSVLRPRLAGLVADEAVHGYVGEAVLAHRFPVGDRPRRPLSREAARYLVRSQPAHRVDFFASLLVNDRLAVAAYTLVARKVGEQDRVIAGFCRAVAADEGAHLELARLGLAWEDSPRSEVMDKAMERTRFLLSLVPPLLEEKEDSLRVLGTTSHALMARIHAAVSRDLARLPFPAGIHK